MVRIETLNSVYLLDVRGSRRLLKAQSGTEAEKYKGQWLEISHILNMEEGEVFFVTFTNGKFLRTTTVKSITITEGTP